MHTPSMVSPTSILRLFVLSICLSFFSLGSALADDWVASRLRGQVVVLDNGQWVQLQRGGVVSDDRVIRTGANGKVTFVRGKEQIGLEPNTQIQIIDASGTLKTRVIQKFGTVAIEAERRNVQHFSVQTPFMAAVVKGTRFVVTSGANGASVAVQRGVVQVTDLLHEVTTDVVRGQNASVGTGAGGLLLVEGPGAKRPFVLKSGQVVKREDLVEGHDGEPVTGKIKVGEHSNVSGQVSSGPGGKGSVSVDVGVGGGTVNVGGGAGGSGGNGSSGGAGSPGGSGNVGGSGNSGLSLDVGLGGSDGLRLGLGL